MKYLGLSLLSFFLIIACKDNNTNETNKLKNDSRPNVIIIVTDDQGYEDLGIYGSPDILTPHLDQMAKEGVRLTSFNARC